MYFKQIKLAILTYSCPSRHSVNVFSYRMFIYQNINNLYAHIFISTFLKPFPYFAGGEINIQQKLGFFCNIGTVASWANPGI